MTEPTDFEATEQLLPGLAPPRHGESSMVTAARRTIVALEGAGYLDETHAVLCEQLLRLAEVVDKGVAQGKASAAAMAAAQILATYQLMRPDASGGEDDGYDELVAQFRRGAPAMGDSP